MPPVRQEAHRDKDRRSTIEIPTAIPIAKGPEQEGDDDKKPTFVPKAYAGHLLFARP